MFDCEYAPYLK